MVFQTINKKLLELGPSLGLWKRITKNSKIYNKCLYYIIRHRTLSETRLATKK